MVLVDANVIVRLLMKDHELFFQRALEFFQETKEIYVEESVLAECYYVMTKFYKIEKTQVLEDLRQLLLLPNVSSDAALLEALLILKTNNIDFVDALLCARAKIYDYEVMSFDEKVSQCTKQ